VIKFVSDLRQVSGFLRVHHDITEILLKVVFNTVSPGWVKPKNIQLVFVPSLLSSQH